MSTIVGTSGEASFVVFLRDTGERIEVLKNVSAVEIKPTLGAIRCHDIGYRRCESRRLGGDRNLG